MALKNRDMLLKGLAIPPGEVTDTGESKSGSKKSKFIRTSFGRYSSLENTGW